MEKEYMDLALAEAARAYQQQEVPVGAVLVRNGQVIASASNMTEAGRDATEHAEMRVIRQASRRLGSGRLVDCELYVTMEPCPMCAGAILLARIPRVVFGVKDPARGAFGSVIDLTKYPLGHRPEIVAGCEQGACHDLLHRFFAERR